mmetsp:Transcript_19779/g.46685  ORF Transcript_19779/g.46685 Transcript_19779/m.46685 type:complete len:348 (-) Transcript_19779:33-1076(-)
MRHVRVLHHVGREHAKEHADQGRADEDLEEEHTGERDVDRVDLGVLEREHGAREHDGHRVVHHGLAEDHGEEVDLHAESLEHREHGHRVGRRDERAERQRGQAAHRVADARLAGIDHEPSHGKGGHDGTDEGEERGGEDVVEEGLAVHVVARLEDDGGQQPDHEELKVEAHVRHHHPAVRHLEDGRRGDAEQHGHARLGQVVEVERLKVVRNQEGEDQADQANHDRPLERDHLDLLLLHLLAVLQVLLVRGVRFEACGRGAQGEKHGVQLLIHDNLRLFARRERRGLAFAARGRLRGRLGLFRLLGLRGLRGRLGLRGLRGVRVRVERLVVLRHCRRGARPEGERRR